MSCKHNLKAEGSNAIQGLNPDYSNRTYLHGTAPQSGTRGVINIPSSVFVHICMLVCADNEHLEFIFTAPTSWVVLITAGVERTSMIGKTVGHEVRGSR